jgi:pyruvate dehydrogenase E2 component (dihydrolipoamide acetyltransferase)
LRGLSLQQIAIERSRLVEQARSGHMAAETLSAPTFTLSNLGKGHIDQFTAIISPPQVAILSVGSVQLRPLVVGAAIEARPSAVFTLGADHRAIDGRQAGRFLERLKTELEASA